MPNSYVPPYRAECRGRLETMIRLSISVAFALAVATSAEAMSPAPLHQSDGMITQIRKARQCEDPNQVRINGICEYLSFPFWRRTPGRCGDPNQIRINGICQYNPPMSPDPNTFVFGGMKAFALSTMGRSRLGEDLCPVRR